MLKKFKTRSDVSDGKGDYQPHTHTHTYQACTHTHKHTKHTTHTHAHTNTHTHTHTHTHKHRASKKWDSISEKHKNRVSKGTVEVC